MPKKYPHRSPRPHRALGHRQAFEISVRVSRMQGSGPELDVGPATLLRWVVQSQADADAGEKDGLNTDEQDELKRIGAEVWDLKRVNEILKAASIVWSSGKSGAGRPLVCRFIGELRAEDFVVESTSAVRM